MARILIATFGSYGDLHPYMALGIELQRRGHEVVIATSPGYREKVLSEALGFCPVRPDVALGDRALMEYVFDARHGTERVVRYLTSLIRESYEDTVEAARRADAIITHPITFAAVLAARKLELPWISTVLAPISFLSSYDPPVPAPMPWLVKLRVFGPNVMQRAWEFGRRKSTPWVEPVYNLAHELGLTIGHPLFEGSHSPSLVLALFSRQMAERQPDWPPATLITGFPFYDRHHEQEDLAPGLRNFLADGPAPVVFTLGSSAVGAAGNFFRDSLKAVGELGRRALFLTGPHPQGLPEKLPAGVLAADYAPHSAVFPHAAAIVHQGGIGTTAQALRAGRPMLVVPFGHDQFDNGARMRRLGVAEVLYRTRYSARRAASRLQRLVTDTRYAKASAALGERVAQENGTATAADAVENCLRSAKPAGSGQAR